MIYPLALIWHPVLRVTLPGRGDKTPNAGPARRSTTPTFLTHGQSRLQVPWLMAEVLTLFNPRLDGLSRESGRGLAQEMQGGLVKPREAPPLEIRAGQRLYALQPCGKRRCLRQCLHRIVGDDAMFLGTPMVLKTVIAGATCQLRSGLRLHD